MGKYIYTAFTNANPGREDEFNDWYDNRHLADLLNIQGIVSAQRFRSASVQRGNYKSPYKYMTTYEIETNDLQNVISEIVAKIGTPSMPISGAMNQDRYSSIWDVLSRRMILSDYER